jgi:hypothetical protein
MGDERGEECDDENERPHIAVLEGVGLQHLGPRVPLYQAATALTRVTYGSIVTERTVVD